VMKVVWLAKLMENLLVDKLEQMLGQQVVA
jgi:hypothetical protein